MKRKLFIAVGVIVLISTLFLGCLPAPSSPKTTPTTSGTAVDTAQNARIDELANKIAQLESKQGASGGVSQATVDALSTKITALETKAAALDTANKATQADLNAVITNLTAEEITALKTKLGMTSSSSSSSSSGSSTSPDIISGQVTYSVNPSTLNPIFTGTSGSSPYYYSLRLMNGMSNWQYIKPVLTLSISSGYSSTIMEHIEVAMSSSICSISSVTDCDSPSGTSCVPETGWNLAISPSTYTATSSIVIIPVSGCGNSSGEFQVGPNSYIDILVTITNFKTSTNTLWNLTHTISSRGV